MKTAIIPIKKHEITEVGFNQYDFYYRINSTDYVWCINWSDFLKKKETYMDWYVRVPLLEVTTQPLPSPSLPSDEEIHERMQERKFVTPDGEIGYQLGMQDMRSIFSTRIAEMERESERMMQLENALKDSQILLNNFKSYATDSSAPVYFGGVSLDDALNTNWNLIKSITTTK